MPLRTRKNKIIIGNKENIKKKKVNRKKVLKSSTDISVLSYDNLRSIFSHLRARDLWNCSTVSRLWQDVAKRELDTRGVVVKAGAFNKLFEECDSSTHINNYLTNKPMLGIIFNSFDREYPECVARHFPLDSYCISVSNYGVIFNNEEHEKIENYSAFSLLPDDPDVDIDLITANHFSMILTNKKRGRFKSVSTSFWRSYGCIIGAIYQSFRSSVRRLRQVKCVIIFVNQNAECAAEPSIPDVFEKPQSDVEKQLSTDVNNYLSVTQSYDLMRYIFSHISGRELCNSSKVCKLWRDAAFRELKTRKSVIHFGSPKNFFKTNGHANKDFDNKLTNKPMLGFLFSSRCKLPECLPPHVPSSCVCLSIKNYGLIVNSTEHEHAQNLLAYTFLPQDPTVNMNLFIESRCRRKAETNLPPNSYAVSDLRSLFELVFSDTPTITNVKCIIIFVIDNNPFSFADLSSYIKDNKIAFWGGAVRNFSCSLSGTTVTNTSFMGIVISGDNVRSWSTILTRDDETEESVVTKLTELKKRVQLLKHSIGLMFSCVARGSGWYDGNKKNVGATIFKNLFPTIPLIGSFGNGELGSYSFEDNSDVKNRRPFQLNHQYSTTIMILTYGK
ncbi:uncharacterized protein LOC141529827 [Cotesia typhae]|uniref:uncharacterized protein LOC141529827 n=1 Tax=Cotesia typhae TaxID=2053667 RepID=UPI003D692116